MAEAAAVLRISRGAAYDLTREWRSTGGRAGLPVIMLGSRLRVPRAALERLLRGEPEPLAQIQPVREAWPPAQGRRRRA